MLFGEYQHSIDAKGRLNFPAKLREHLGERFYVTKGLDGCLAVYAEDEWKVYMDKLRVLKKTSEGRDYLRDLTRATYELEPDKQGRVLIHANLRDHAGLDKNVLIIGASDHVQIWDNDKLDKRPKLTEEKIAALMEGIDY